MTVITNKIVDCHVCNGTGQCSSSAGAMSFTEAAEVGVVVSTCQKCGGTGRLVVMSTQQESNLSDRPIAQFDMDGTVADFDAEMIRRLNAIRHPSEPEVIGDYRALEDKNPWLKERIRLIMNEDSFWDDLPPLQLGFDVLSILDELGFDTRVLTKGPKSNPRAYTRKVLWCERYLPGRDVTVTRDKGQVYGRVLVDDYPDYVLSWLKWRKRGTVIMPAGNSNIGFYHPQAVRYDGTNITAVRSALVAAARRG